MKDFPAKDLQDQGSFETALRNLSPGRPGLILGRQARTQRVGFAPRALPQTPASDWLHTGSDGHLMSFAPTGAGKSLTQALPALLSWSGSAIVFDPKGELTRLTAKVRRAMGQNVVVLDPFGITGEAAGSLNPVDILLQHPENLWDNAAALAENLVVETGTSDPFWDRRAQQLLAHLIHFVARESPKALRTLGEVNYLLTQTPKDLALTMADMRRHKDPVIRQGAGILPLKAERTVASIVACAQRYTRLDAGEMIRLCQNLARGHGPSTENGHPKAAVPEHLSAM